MDRLSWENRYGRAAATLASAGRGNGYVVPVIGKTDFAFDARTSGTVQTIPLATGIDTSSWVSGVIAVRIFAKTGSWVPPTLTCVVQNIVLCPEEPSVVFLSPTAVATVTVGDNTANTAAGSLVIGTLGAMGPMVRVILSLTAGNNAAVGITLGVDLVGRPA